VGLGCLGCESLCWFGLGRVWLLVVVWWPAGSGSWGLVWGVGNEIHFGFLFWGAGPAWLVFVFPWVLWSLAGVCLLGGLVGCRSWVLADWCENPLGLVDLVVMSVLIHWLWSVLGWRSTGWAGVEIPLCCPLAAGSGSGGRGVGSPCLGGSLWCSG